MKTPEILALNNEQKKAVQYTAGPLLIIAGAGTGKTTIIVEKIKHIIKSGLAKPNEILALTFTEKAAYEMETRVDQAMPYGYFQMSIATFHSFAERILRQEAGEIGLSTAYRLMTEAETIIFLRKNLFLFHLSYFRPLGNPHKFLKGLLQHFSRLKDEDITPTDYKKWVDKQKEEKEKYQELAAAYETYEKLKVKLGFFDYSDLVSNLVKLFRDRPADAKKYQQQFPYILIDEFQDTNISQYALIKLLSPPRKNPHLTVVGDDSQAIYKFRGASISNIMTFMRDYKKAKQVTVRTNYRSNQTILDSAYRLIKHNDPDTLEAQLGISKELVGLTKGTPDSVKFFIAKKNDGEADIVVSEILKLKKNYEYRDFALLVRANNHAVPFFQAFSRAGIPYQFLGPSALYKQPEIKDLIAYLKILNNLEDSVSLYRVLTIDLFKIDVRDISLLLSFCKKTSLSLFETIEIYLSFYYPALGRAEYEVYKKYLPLLREPSRKTIHSLYLLITKHLSRLKKDTAGQILFDFLEKTGLLQNLTTFKNEKEEREATNVSRFFSRLKTYEIEHEDASVATVTDFIDMSMELGDSPLFGKQDAPDIDAVNILTVHGSKGLEFPVVFLPSLIQGRFPSYEKKDTIPIPDSLIKEILPQGDYHLEEERRLFYVGLTRACDIVVLTAANFYGEGKRERKISPFVSEAIGEGRVKTLLNTNIEEKKQLTIFDFKKPVTIEPNARLELNTFSFSQLSTYETCPLQYKYQYVLKIPTPAAASAAFGDTVHKTLEAFYNEFKDNRKVGLARLLELFHKNWVPLGYQSPAHQKKMKEEGVAMLEKYFVTLHDKNARVGPLEQFFKIKVEKDISIVGKIDRLDYKSNNEIEIIDYKTGKKPDDKQLKKSLQLSIYALAATNHGLYKKELTQVNLTFYYLQGMEKFSMKRAPEDMYTTKEKIKNTVEKIRQNDFPPNVGPWCDFCPFRMICEAWQ